MRTRRALASTVIALGLFGAGLGLAAYGVERTALDPALSSTLAGSLLDAPAVRERLQRDLASELADQVAASTDAAPVAAAAAAALDDPRVVAAFTDAVETVHAQVLGAPGGPVTLDTTALSRALRDAITATDPALAARWPADAADAAVPTITLAGADRPDLSGLVGFVPRLAALAALAAVALLGLGAWAHPDPPMALRRIGVRLLLLGLAAPVSLLVGPVLLEWLGVGGGIAGPIASAVWDRLLPAAVLVASAGAAVLCESLLLRLPDRAAGLHPAPAPS